MSLQIGCTRSPADAHTTLRADLNAAIQRSANYLESQQADNGSWPSETYGLFRDGVAPTPHVLRSLTAANRDNEHIQRAFAFLAEHVTWTRTHPSRPVLSSAVTGTVYFCADTHLAIVAQCDPSPSKLTDIYKALPLMQIRDDDAQVFAQEGGWGYRTFPFSGLPKNFKLLNQFDHGRSPTPIFPQLSANISATVYALDATPLPASYLTGHGRTLPKYTRMIQAALRFASRCQNDGTGDDRFDDGGFFFNPADAARNKGGPAGTDANGYARFHSSGSSTADGLRALIRCLLPKNDPRVVAARDWLFKHFDPDQNPGTFNDDREVLRDAYYFYYAASVADTFTLLGEGPDNWEQDLALAIMKKQRPDGSFTNPFTDGKEDDPLVATPFALRAMLTCREALPR